jgi:pyridinium-3,5-bisthiocarboxylic acid mononucleotide nickel chelatase
LPTNLGLTPRVHDDRPSAPFMRIAYLDCFSGISGDMFLGALVDAGVPRELLTETVAALNIGARIEMSRVNRSGITATKVDVYRKGERDRPRDSSWEKLAKDQHAHGQQHHEHSSEPGPKPVQLAEHNYGLTAKTSENAGVSAFLEEDPHSRVHSHSHEPTRGLSEIRQMISSAAISETAKKTAIMIFEALGSSEAKIHNVAIEKVHFHEVGAVDALVDIVCAAVGAEAMGVAEIVCSPLNVGGGTVECAHGTFPVPAPATLDLLKDAPVYSSGIQAELVTPTGAAIVRTLVKRFTPFPAMRVEKIGYGAGSRNFPRYANVVRLTIGEAQPTLAVSASQENEIIAVLETNIDDMNPQIFAYVMERALEQGALDAFSIPVQMKKNRPGMLMTVLCRTEDAPKLTQLLFAETSTLGVRHREERREILARKLVTVNTRWGDVRFKVASRNGTVTNCAPEYEDCRRIAAEHHVPLKTVMQEAVQRYLGTLDPSRAEAVSK